MPPKRTTIFGKVKGLLGAANKLAKDTEIISKALDHFKFTNAAAAARQFGYGKPKRRRAAPKKKRAAPKRR